MSFEILSTTNAVLATHYMKDINGKEPLIFSEQSAGYTTANFWATSNFIYDYVVDIPSIIAANNQSLSDVASVKVISAIDEVLNTDVFSTNAQINYPDGFVDNILFSPGGVVEMEHTMPITNGLIQQPLSVLPLQTTKSNFYCETNSQMFYAVGYGGTPPYTYTWQKNVNGNIQNASPLVVDPDHWGGLSTNNFVFNGDYNIEEVYEQNFVSTPTATHTVTVTDANGNTVTASTEYIRPTVTFSQEALLDALVPSATNECVLDMTVPISSLFSNELGQPITWNEYDVDFLPFSLSPQVYTVNNYQIILRHCRTDCVYGFVIPVTDDMLAGSVDAISLPTSGTLTGEYRVKGTWVIPTGNTLTLDNAHIQFTTESSKVLVQKGAKLIIRNNSLLEAFRCDTNLPNVWQGIRAIGTPTMDHPAAIDPITQLNNFFGMVIVDNATIKHAKIAICNTDTNDPTNISTYFLMLRIPPKKECPLITIYHFSKYCYRKRQIVILLFCSPKKVAKKGVFFRVDSSGVLWSLLNFVVAIKFAGILSVLSY